MEKKTMGWTKEGKEDEGVDKGGTEEGVDKAGTEEEGGEQRKERKTRGWTKVEK